MVSSKLNSSKVIDINGGVDLATDGTNIQIFNLNNTRAQEWELKYNVDDGYYTIINPTTGKAIDVEGASTEKGANVQLYRSNGTCAQKWQIIENDDETYSFYSSCSGLALDLSGGIANSGANINIWRVNGSGAQRWRLKHYNSLDNTSLIEAKYSIASNLDINERIDINGGVEYADIGTNIQLWHNNETAAQQWFLRKNNDGTYTFVNTDTGKVIDAKGGSGEKGANIQLWNDNGTCAQKWFIEEKSGGYVFRSSCSGLVIDASGGIANDGVNINLWNENGTEAQVWNLMKIQ